MEELTFLWLPPLYSFLFPQLSHLSDLVNRCPREYFLFAFYTPSKNNHAVDMASKLGGAQGPCGMFLKLKL